MIKTKQTQTPNDKNLEAPLPTITLPSQRFDRRAFAVMAGFTLLGALWAFYNYISIGAARGEAQIRPLVWTIFATPFALFIGWTLARRAEFGRAAFMCFCLYFFSVFIAARIESLFVTMEQAAAMGHSIYFQTTVILQFLVSLGLIIWRALDQRLPIPDKSKPHPPDEVVTHTTTEHQALES